MSAIRDQATAAQHRASQPEASVWVSASAGTGKTKVLTDRVLRLLLAGVEPARLLCLTFTNAATAEMRNRINNKLGAWTTIGTCDLTAELGVLLNRAASSDECAVARKLFANVLDAPGGMKIMTIHAFCQSVLRRFPLEAAIVPHFEVMDEHATAEILKEAQAELMARLRGDRVTVTIANAWSEVTCNVHETEFAALIGALASERGRLTRLTHDAGGVDELIARTARFLGIDADATEETVIATACADEAFNGDNLRRAAEALAQGSPADRKRGVALEGWLDAGSTRVKEFDSYIAVFLTDKLEARKRFYTQGAVVCLQELPRILGAEQSRLLDVVDWQRKARLNHATASLLRLGLALLDIYKTKKAARACLDYDDLVLEARNLLQGDGLARWVQFKLDGGLDHILIDEAQDSNPDQWQVVAALAEEFFTGLDECGPSIPRSVFAVGDTKQSIFSFQRADPAAFESMRQHFRSSVDNCGRSWEEVPLEVSFRSTGPVLQAVDAVFAAPDARRGLADEPLTHSPERDGAAGLVELWPPIVAMEAPPSETWKPPVERITRDNARARLAQLLAKRMHDWIHKGEMLPARGRRVEPDDIMVLVRRRGPFVEELVRALKEKGVPVAGADRMLLSEQLAVMDLVALGQVLLLPEDDLTLATVLKGPLIGMSEDELFDLAHGRGERSLWRTLVKRTKDLQTGSVTVFSRAHEKLTMLRRRVDFVRPFEFYAELLNGGGRRALLQSLGPEAEDPLDEFLALALAYERTNTPSLQGFLHWLAAGEVEVKRDLEQGRGAVRVMTVHGAKGLEAPIVILPDTMGVPPAPRQTLLWPDDGQMLLWVPHTRDFDSKAHAAREAAAAVCDDEYRRLLYVAMTRAEDRLYVCGWRTSRKPQANCWYNLVHDALAPIARQVDDPDFSNVENGAVLRLEAVQSSLVNPELPQVADVPEPLPEWVGMPVRTEVVPRVLTPSKRTGAEPPVRSPFGTDDGLRFRRGRLIHRLLQTLPDLDPAARKPACHRFLAHTALGLSQDEKAEIADEVMAILCHGDFAPLFGPDSRAEVPIVGMVDSGDGTVPINGRVDRLLVDALSVRIIDYKTDRPGPSSAQEIDPVYIAQMAEYRVLLSRIFPYKTIDCSLLWTDVPCLMVIPEELLDAYAPMVGRVP